ncbi:homeobox protein CHOX-CAD-like [Centruroides vittatus]|uniref:homeobox protein CHOX-CAD-like n=1 Tax=Centruroides vittatus TaxID=120091 RepID=UPI00350EF3EE
MVLSHNYHYNMFPTSSCSNFYNNQCNDAQDRSAQNLAWAHQYHCRVQQSEDQRIWTNQAEANCAPTYPAENEPLAYDPYNFQPHIPLSGNIVNNAEVSPSVLNEANCSNVSSDYEMYDKHSKVEHRQECCALDSPKGKCKDKYRVVYSEFQRTELEKQFIQSPYITIERKTEIAKELNLTSRQVKIWFQNRRAKQRKMQKKAEERAKSMEPNMGMMQQQPIPNWLMDPSILTGTSMMPTADVDHFFTNIDSCPQQIKQEIL